LAPEVHAGFPSKIRHFHILLRRSGGGHARSQSARFLMRLAIKILQIRGAFLKTNRVLGKAPRIRGVTPAAEVLMCAGGSVKIRMRRPHEEGRTKSTEIPRKKIHVSLHNNRFHSMLS
jgi:hypothetical protein